MYKKVVRIGDHSLGIIIPAAFVHLMDVHAGDKVWVDVKPETGKLMVRFKDMLQLSLLHPKQANK